MTITRAQICRFIILTALWAMALFCMIQGSFTFDGDADPAQRAWFSWGLFLSLVAQIPTGWCIVAWYAKRERLRMEYLARIMAQEAMHHHDDGEPGTVLTLR